MTQKSKEILAWLKESLINTDLEPICDTLEECAEWRKKADAAIDLLDKVAEMEVYATRGGYIKDCRGNICKDGDKVMYCLNCNSEPTFAKLYWNKDGDFLVQSFEEGKNPYYLWEISDWYKAEETKA